MHPFNQTLREGSNQGAENSAKRIRGEQGLRANRLSACGRERLTALVAVRSLESATWSEKNFEAASPTVTPPDTLAVDDNPRPLPPADRTGRF